VSWIGPPFFFFNKDCKTAWKNIISVLGGMWGGC
jgi:hypothetical protein